MAKLYIKNTDGTFTPYSSITVTNLDIVQGKGNSLTLAMSQKAVTDKLEKKQDVITGLATIRSNASIGCLRLMRMFGCREFMVGKR